MEAPLPASYSHLKRCYERFARRMSWRKRVVKGRKDEPELDVFTEEGELMCVGVFCAFAMRGWVRNRSREPFEALPLNLQAQFQVTFIFNFTIQKTSHTSYPVPLLKQTRMYVTLPSSFPHPTPFPTSDFRLYILRFASLAFKLVPRAFEPECCEI